MLKAVTFSDIVTWQHESSLVSETLFIFRNSFQQSRRERGLLLQELQDQHVQAKLPGNPLWNKGSASNPLLYYATWHVILQGAATYRLLIYGPLPQFSIQFRH